MQRMEAHPFRPTTPRKKTCPQGPRTRGKDGHPAPGNLISRDKSARYKCITCSPSDCRKASGGVIYSRGGDQFSSGKWHHGQFRPSENSAGAKAQPLFRRFAARLKSCPVTKPASMEPLRQSETFACHECSNAIALLSQPKTGHRYTIL
jgi:hypothetical protein